MSHSLSVAHLVVVDELLLDDLHGVDALRAPLLDHQHLGVAATSDHPQQLEVVQLDRRVVAGGRLRPKARGN